MGKNVSFSLDLGGGAYVLQTMAKSAVQAAGERIAGRATAMAASISSEPPTITCKTSVRRIKKGERAVAIVGTDTNDEHERYIARTAISKSIDAGKVSS